MESVFDEAMALQAQGCNCAETIMIMSGRYFLPDIDYGYSRLVTGFGGGVGRCREEACGALTGCVIVISMLLGRDGPHDESWPVHEKVYGFRKIFQVRFGNTVCGRLRDGYEPEDALKMCHSLTAETVCMLFDFLESAGAKRKVI